MIDYVAILPNSDHTQGLLRTPLMAARMNLANMGDLILQVEQEYDEAQTLVFQAQLKANELQRMIRRFTLDAVQAGMPEAEAARYAGVHRMTVRNWQGKGAQK